MEIEEQLKQYIKKKIYQFLEERGINTQGMETKDIDSWRDSIYNQVIEEFEDNDIFYDNVPENIEEIIEEQKD